MPPLKLTSATSSPNSLLATARNSSSLRTKPDSSARDSVSRSDDSFKSAEYLATTIEIAAGRLGLRASGRVLKFAGFQKLYGMDEEDDATESRIPALKPEQPLKLAGVALCVLPGVRPCIAQF